MESQIIQSLSSLALSNQFEGVELEPLDSIKDSPSCDIYNVSTRSYLEPEFEFSPKENSIRLLNQLDEINPGEGNFAKQALVRSHKRPKSKKGQNELRAFKRISKPKKSKLHQQGIEKEPKKEYVRVKLIRGHKRAIRKILLSKPEDTIKPPTTTINKIERNNHDQYEAWTIFVENTKSSYSELKEICPTNKGPLTDGKSFRKVNGGNNIGNQDNQEKTFNNTFSKEYFSRPAILENFKFYVDYLFARQSSQSLKNKFKFYCCRTNNCKTCTDKWEKLHVFIKDFLTSSPIFEDGYMDLDENNDDQVVFENESDDFETN